MNKLFVSTSLLILTLMLMIPMPVIQGTNESSYQYGFERGSLKSPQITPGANWNPEFDNNTCALRGSYTLDNPKGVVIPAVTNTTACTIGWFSGVLKIATYTIENQSVQLGLKWHILLYDVFFRITHPVTPPEIFTDHTVTNYHLRLIN